MTIGQQVISRAPIAQWLEALLEDARAHQESLLNRVDALNRRALSNEVKTRVKADWYQPIAQASMAAIQVAALVPEPIRQHISLGDIVLTADGSWVEPDPDSLFLGGEHTSGAANLVHPILEADTDTLHSLKQLGIRPASAESVFREKAGSSVGALFIWESRR